MTTTTATTAAARSHDYYDYEDYNYENYASCYCDEHYKSGLTMLKRGGE